MACALRRYGVTDSGLSYPDQLMQAIPTVVLPKRFLTSPCGPSSFDEQPYWTEHHFVFFER
ncbi:MAG: hypothetical protein P8X74_19480 [Reinekea sp.]